MSRWTVIERFLSAVVQDTYAFLVPSKQLGCISNVVFIAFSKRLSNYPCYYPCSSPSRAHNLILSQLVKLPQPRQHLATKPVDKPDGNQLRSLLDNASALYLSLSSLGTGSDIAQTMLIFIVIGKCDQQTLTKRTILSTASSLIDPLGLLAPIIIALKIIIQELWLLKLAWDESVPQSLLQAWRNCVTSLKELSSISVLRFCLQAELTDIQLHAFCDASIRAYGCCVYMRSTDSYGNVQVQLLTAKSRVASIKKLTLPRLELSGAQLLNIVQFYFVKSLVPCHLSAYPQTSHGFCGAVNTYLRIRGKGPIKSYIAIYVCMAVKAVHIEIVSDLSTNKFLKSLKRMVACRGPVSHIYSDNATNFVGASNKLLELKKFMFNTSTQDAMLSYCSSEEITFHFIPLRALHFGGLWEAAVKSAKSLLVRTLANTRFTFEELNTTVVEIDAVLNSRPLSPLSSDPNDFSALTAGHFLNGDAPRVLPEREIIINNISNLDRYEQITAVKQQFWRRWSAEYVNGLRATTKWTSASPNLTVDSMVIIHEDNTPPLHWKLGRVESVVSGKDDRFYFVKSLVPCHLSAYPQTSHGFCGAVNTYLRIRGKGPIKSYIAIYVCMAVMAVHIEIVSEFSTNKFLKSLKRMVACRGPVSHIYSDNATNFVGASNKLLELKKFMFNTSTQDAMLSYCSSEEITFHFIPLRALHFGGLWEAAVKSAKSLLVRTLANTRFTFEELNTTVVEIDAVLNSRPLSPLSSDPNDFSALTAGHFLNGDAPRVLPEREIIINNISNLDRYEQITAVKQQFWRRWSAEYVNGLRATTKWTSASPNLTVDSMVIIHEDNTPPLHWKLGRVESVVSGKDDRGSTLWRSLGGRCQERNEELNNAVVEIDAVLNSRPLSPLSSDPNDFSALTAGQFLNGDAPCALPEREIIINNISNLDLYEQASGPVS
ncbi:uncharacterized protein [Drosophila virilis]|uniref:uncharacterized protein n=1 Tax=Drosophila virilis TaxID=7244 RepID=UPI0038B348A4